MKLPENEQTGHALEIVKHWRKKASDLNLVHAVFFCLEDCVRRDDFLSGKYTQFALDSMINRV
jgi:hypothetical protein